MERTDGARFHKTRTNQPLRFGLKASAAHRAIRLIMNAAGSMAVSAAMKNFEVEGFIDKTVEKWPDKKKSNGHKILRKTGRMRQSVHANKSGNTVTLSAPVPYSGVHNRPVGQMKKYGNRMYPGRQFMGHSEKLALDTYKMIVTQLNLAMQK